MTKYLITGGTGSFGRTMTRFILAKPGAEVVVFSRDEAKQDEMRHEFNNQRLSFIGGDTRHYRAIYKAPKGVARVFHAAALKQVPSCEFNPMEAVKTNIEGSANVLEAAIEQEVNSVVVLSTDKAVYPVNAMGISKAMMEKVALSYARQQQDTRIMVTRYGNVMYSRGSVIPLFINQIRSGNLTITDPNMTRFLMSLDDSVDLVQRAWELGNNGDLFVRKAPAATIGTIAEAVQEIFGKAESVFTIGARHGEKLHESLLSAEERATAQEVVQYYRVPLDQRNLNYITSKPMILGEAYTSENTNRLDVEATKELILRLPEVQKALSR